MSAMTANARFLLGAASLGVIATLAVTTPVPAAAQEAHAGTIIVPAMPLAQAIERIGAQSGVAIGFDPDAVKGHMSQPVRGATSAHKALEDAIRGSGLTIIPAANGGLTVVNDIVVTAQRDEAETNVIVRQASTSDRSGLGLRNQPRNTQVITAKTIEEQQALNITDILTNAGGVVSQLNNPNAGSTYTVRGFAAGGLVNGLAGTSQFGVTTGSSQPVANIERVEILKGPDALLSGFNNLGGNVNVVTKKPSAEERMTVSLDTGSFGLIRGVLDANNAITSDKKLSARLVVSGQTMDHNYGGYTGNQEFLFAPSLRYKDRLTDIVIGASLSNATTGLAPFNLFNRATAQLANRNPYLPLYSSDQQIRSTTDRFYFDITRQLTPGIEIVARGLHDNSHLGLDLYPIAYNTRRNALGVAIRGSGQQGAANAVDSYVRVKTHIADVMKMSFNVGYNYANGYTEQLSSTPYTIIYDIPTGTIPLGVNTTLPVQPRPPVNPPTYRSGGSQQAVYGQALIEIWKIKLLGGVRKNWFDTYSQTYPNPPSTPVRRQATTPNGGIIFDATRNFSIFANYTEGVQATLNTDFNRNLLPNIQTENKEAGVKLDLFHKNATINASYFDIQQDNTLRADVAHPGYFIPGPGQNGRGIDLNIVGRVLPGLTVQGSFTRTIYKLVTVTATQTTVAGQPRDTYSLYANYGTRISNDMTGGIGAGLFGRSSSFADYLGKYVVPPSRQVNLNGFLSYKGFNFNLGLRNVFNRRNYNVTTVADFVPVDEPRNFRLTISKRLF